MLRPFLKTTFNRQLISTITQLTFLYASQSQYFVQGYLGTYQNFYKTFQKKFETELVICRGLQNYFPQFQFKVFYSLKNTILRHFLLQIQTPFPLNISRVVRNLHIIQCYFQTKIVRSSTRVKVYLKIIYEFKFTDTYVSFE